MPLKEYIRFLDEQQPAADKIIVHDLDDTHLFIKPAKLEYVQTKVREWSDRVHFEAPKDTAGQH